VTNSGTLAVLQLVANRWWTGSADPVIQLSRGLRERGHRVLLGIIPGGPFEDKARRAGFEPVAGLSLEAKLRPAAIVRDVSRLRRLVNAEGIEVVHTHHSHDHWLGWLCRGRAALVRTFHNRRSANGHWPSTALYGLSDALLCVSDQIAARCCEAGVPGDRLFDIDPVVDTARFAPSGGGEKIREEFGIGDNPLVGCVARLAPNRGHEQLIRGFAQALPAHPTARLLLVGKGEARAHLEEFVDALGLRQRVLFAGYRDADLPAVLGALDAFALMAAGSDESCRAAVEAMAAARPVVAPRVGALTRVVEHGVTGLLLDSDRPETVAGALHRLLADPDEARLMGEAGRSRAKAFAPERHAEQVEALYRRALARRSRR